MNRLSKVSLIFTILVFFASGCSSIEKITGDGKPSESEARKRFEYLYKDKIDDGTIKVIDFQKVNAVDHKNQYNLMWKARVEYLKDTPKGCCPLYPGLPPGGPFKAGQVEEIEGTYLYFPTENGYKTRNMHGKYEEPY